MFKSLPAYLTAYPTTYAPKRALAFVSLAVVALASTGCPGWQPRVVPVPALTFTELEEPSALVLLLPGLMSEMGDFSYNGFVDSLVAARPEAEIRAVDLHLGYFWDGVAERRLLEDHVLPARRRGVEEIWIVGISLGGLGAASFLAAYPDEVDGVVLLAPWLGKGGLIDEIEKAGGPQAWAQQPGHGPLDPESLPAADAPDLWRALVPLLSDAGKTPPVWLGFGDDDRFAEAHRQLQTLLPSERVLTMDGGHRWRVWKPLLDDALAAGALRMDTLAGNASDRPRDSGTEPSND